MNLLRKRNLMKQVSNSVLADDSASEQGRQLCQMVKSTENQKACAVHAGDPPVLELLKPQTIVALADTEVDRVFVSRYKPGDVEKAEVQSELNLVDIETPELSDEDLVFLDLEMDAQAKWAVHVAPTVINLARDYDAIVLGKTELLTDSEVELLQETISKIRDFKNSLPVFYLHTARASESPEAADSQYQANVEKLNTLGNVSTFQCDALDPSDPAYEEFRKEWRKIVDSRRDAFVSELWPKFISSAKSLKQDYQGFINKLDGKPKFDAKVEAYHRILKEHPNKSLNRAWEDVALTAKDMVSKAFSGNNGDDTLYDIIMQDLPESADSADWDRWQVSKNSEILQAFLEFVRVLEEFFYSEYKRIRTDGIEAIFVKLSDAGLTSDLPPEALSELRARVEEDLHLRELSPNLTSTVEELFRYGFMGYLLGSLSVATVSGIAMLIAAWKGGAEAAAATSPLGPVAATIAFVAGFGIGAFTAHQMIKSTDTKNWRAEAQKELSRLLNSLQTETLNARESLWIAYKRLLEDSNEELHTTVSNLLTEEIKIFEQLNQATPEQLEAIRSQKLAVIETLDAVLASEDPTSEEPASEADAENRVD